MVTADPAGAGDEDVVRARVELQAGPDGVQVVKAERRLVTEVAREGVLEHLAHRPVEGHHPEFSQHGTILANVSSSRIVAEDHDKTAPERFKATMY